MGLFQDWERLLKNQNKSTIDKFWKEYSEAEETIYTEILEHKDEKLSGKVGELAERFHVRPVIFTGFLDGVNSSLKEADSLDLDNVTEETEVSLDIDFNALFLNMHKADAPHLYGLEAWNDVLSEEAREAIVKEYKKSKIYHAPKKPGRNDPCPCGSGKKYKNCCGKNA